MAFAVGCAGLAGAPALAADAEVTATNDNVFDPDSVKVGKGDTVTWRWAGNNLPPTKQHTVTSSSSNWEINDTLTTTDRTATFTFTAGGTYTYYCEVHGTPDSGMRGSVTVPMPPTPTPSPTKSTTPRPSPTRSPTPGPTATRTTPPPPTATTPPTTDEPSPTGGTVSGPPIMPGPTATPGASVAPPVVALPSGAVTPSDSPSVTGRPIGLTAPPATHRERGLPLVLAVLGLVGVVSAQVRTLLAAAGEQ